MKFQLPDSKGTYSLIGRTLYRLDQHGQWDEITEVIETSPINVMRLAEIWYDSYDYDSVTGPSWDRRTAIEEGLIEDDDSEDPDGSYERYRESRFADE